MSWSQGTILIIVSLYNIILYNKWIPSTFHEVSFSCYLQCELARCWRCYHRKHLYLPRERSRYKLVLHLLGEGWCKYFKLEHDSGGEHCGRGRSKERRSPPRIKGGGVEIGVELGVGGEPARGGRTMDYGQNWTDMNDSRPAMWTILEEPGP